MRIANWLRKLVRVISRLAELCSKLKPIFAKADELNRALQSGFDGALAKIPGLRSPALNPRTTTVPGLPGQPSFTQYPRNTLGNNVVTEGSKPAQE